ncbi:MAG: hypothetical protein ABSH08_06710 [Tepidisphaeraceae bacterium]
MTELTADTQGTTQSRPGWKRLGREDYLLAGLVALFFVLLEQVLQVRVGLNLADEGFLWYGVQRVLAGEVPVRDFQAYEPGRYYLLAGWARMVQSDGIVAMRYGLAVLQWTALFPALLLALRVLPSRWLLPAFGMLLSLWMAPRHKIPDVAAPMWMLYALALLIARADRKSHFLAGFAAAALWLVGINHVLYGLISVGIVIVAIAWSEKLPWRLLIGRIGWTIAGAALVTLLALIWLLAVPHFFTGYWNNGIVRLLESGATNLTLPIPWPWDVTAPPGIWTALSAYALSIGFVLFPAAVAMAFMVFVSPSRFGTLRQYPVTLAAAAATLAWAHHAFSRADLPHLVQAGAPLLILLVAIPETLTGVWRGFARAMCWSALVFVSGFAAANLSPAIAAWLPNAAKYQWCVVEGEQLWIPDYTRRDYAAASDVIRRLAPGQTALFVPYDPGLYAAFRQRCPIYESYPIFPASQSEQREVVENLQRPGMDWVLCWPDRADRRADLGFDQTDRAAWDYILKNFELVKVVEEARGVRVYHRKAGDGAK